MAKKRKSQDTILKIIQTTNTTITIFGEKSSKFEVQWYCFQCQMTSIFAEDAKESLVYLCKHKAIRLTCLYLLLCVRRSQAIILSVHFEISKPGFIMNYIHCMMHFETSLSQIHNFCRQSTTQSALIISEYVTNVQEYIHVLY